MSEAHLVPDTQGDDVRPRAVFKEVGRLVHQDFLGGVGVVTRHILLRYAQRLGLPAHTFEPIGLLHWVQFCLFDEVADVIVTWDGRVLEGSLLHVFWIY